MKLEKKKKSIVSHYNLLKELKGNEKLDLVNVCNIYKPSDFVSRKKRKGLWNWAKSTGKD